MSYNGYITDALKEWEEYKEEWMVYHEKTSGEKIVDELDITKKIRVETLDVINRAAFINDFGELQQLLTCLYVNMRHNIHCIVRRSSDLIKPLSNAVGQMQWMHYGWSTQELSREEKVRLIYNPKTPIKFTR